MADVGGCKVSLHSYKAGGLLSLGLSLQLELLVLTVLCALPVLVWAAGETCAEGLDAE